MAGAHTVTTHRRARLNLGRLTTRVLAASRAFLSGEEGLVELHQFIFAAKKLAVDVNAVIGWMHLAVAILQHGLELRIRKVHIVIGYKHITRPVLVHDADGQRAVLLDAIAVVQVVGRKCFVTGCVARV